MDILNEIKKIEENINKKIEIHNKKIIDYSLDKNIEDFLSNFKKINDEVTDFDLENLYNKNKGMIKKKKIKRDLDEIKEIISDFNKSISEFKFLIERNVNKFNRDFIVLERDVEEFEKTYIDYNNKLNDIRESVDKEEDGKVINKLKNLELFLTMLEQQKIQYNKVIGLRKDFISLYNNIFNQMLPVFGTMIASSSENSNEKGEFKQNILKEISNFIKI